MKNSLCVSAAAVRVEIDLLRLMQEGQVECAFLKEYAAPWLKKKDAMVARDSSGRFASLGWSQGDPTQKAAEQLRYDLDFPQSQQSIDEAIAKRIAYLDPEELIGDKPQSELTKTGLDFLGRHNVQVHSTLNNTKTGFNAFILEEDGKRKIVFTGTNDRKDLIQDLLDEEIGRSQFSGNKEEIRAALEQSLEETGGKTSLLGHSLGGAIAQITAAEYPDLVQDVAVYNSASISGRTAQKFAEVKNKEEAPQVKLYYHEADIVPTTRGETHLDGEVNTYNGAGFVNPLSAHLDLLTDPRNNYQSKK